MEEQPTQLEGTVSSTGHRDVSVAIRIPAKAARLLRLTTGQPWKAAVSENGEKVTLTLTIDRTPDLSLGPCPGRT